MSSSLFHGTGVALVTPFTDAGELDLSALRRLVEHVIVGGVDYLVPLGTTAESATLSADEQAEVIRTVLLANGGRRPILLGCGGNDTARVVQLLQHYDHTYDVQGYLSVSPYYNRPTQNGIIAHYEALNAATERPIVLYNVPARTGSNVLPDTVIRIAQTCPRVVAIKEASGNLEQGMAILNGAPAGFSVLSGDDALALPGIACGYSGVISVVANVVPTTFCTLIRHAMAGDFTHARTANLKLLPLIQALFAEGNPAGSKAALAVLGLCGAKVRLPLANASHELQVKLHQLLT